MCSSLGYTQMEPQTAFNKFNQLAINPAYAGSTDGICATAIIREELLGFDQAPSTQFFNVHSSFKLFNLQHGAGLSLRNDEAGFTTNITANLAYAFRKELEIGILCIGTNLIFHNLTFNGSGLLAPDGSDGSQDPLVPANGDTDFATDFGLGVHYSTDKVFIGISAEQILKSKVEYPNLVSKGNSIPLDRTFYAITGYNFQLSNPLFEIKPTIFVKSNGKSTQYDFNAILAYNKRFWGGVTYRPVDALVLLFGMEFLNGLKFGVAYEYKTSKLGSYSTIGGGFEFMLGYCFNFSIEKANRSYKSVRFL